MTGWARSRRTRAARVAVAAVAAVAALGVAQPASAATIGSGHLDVFDVDATGSGVSLDIKSYSPANDDLSPASTTLAVPAAALTTVPSGLPSCLGAAGSAVYRLPQTSQSGLLYAGWNTEDSTQPVAITLDVAGSSAPLGGRFALYTTGVGTTSIKLNTNPASGCTVSSFPGGIAAGAHGHAFWTFSAKGTYKLKLKATVGTVSSSWVTYTFQVG